MTHVRERWSRAVAALVAAGVLSLSLTPAALADQWRPNPAVNPNPTKDQVEEAKSRFKQGLRLYQEEGQIEAALIELQRAYDLAPNYRILYNIGQVARSQPDYVTALLAFERYLADGGREVPASRRAEVEKEMNDLRDRVAQLTVTSNLEGATIALNDLPVGRSPLSEPILVNPGRHKLSASKDGRATSKVVTVAGRDRVKVELTIEQTAEPTAPTPTAPAPTPTAPTDATPAPGPTADNTNKQPPPTAPKEPEKPSYTWIGWAATGVFAAGTVVTGVLAMSAASDLEDARYTGAAVPDDVTSQQSKANTLAVVADVFAGATVVALGITLIATFSGSSSDTGSKSPAAGATARREPAPTLRLGIGPGSVRLGGTF